MCLGLTCLVTEVLPDAQVVVRDRSRTLRASLLAHEAPVQVGDWVLVHAGFVLASLTERQARDALALRGLSEKGSR